MALTKDQKKAQVQELVTKLSDAQSVMFSHYIGLSVADVSAMRRQIRESGAEMKVAKKTLMKIAFKEAGYPDIEPNDLDGAVACIFSFSDPLSGAQAAFKFSRDHDQVTLVGGVFDGKLLSKEEATELAKMPGREQLLATFVGMLKSPMTSFAGMCGGPLSGFARALDQMAEKGGFVEAPAEEPKEEAPKEQASAPAESEKKAEEPTAEVADAKEDAAEEAQTDDAPVETDEAEGDAPTEEKPAEEETNADAADAATDAPDNDDSSKEESDS